MQPIVAVVGRPNVGKSTLFNRVVGSRLSIVEDTPGVTRDRLYAETTWQRHKFTVIDTGGLDASSEEYIPQQILRQATLAIDTADVVVFVVDGKAGIVEGDLDAADILRRSGKPVVLVVNKLDDIKQEDLLYEFYSLGLGVPFVLSAVLIDRLKGALDLLRRHSRGINIASGILLVAMGILMATGVLERLLRMLSF